jgi:hypothetical protein
MAAGDTPWAPPFRTRGEGTAVAASDLPPAFNRHSLNIGGIMSRTTWMALFLALLLPATMTAQQGTTEVRGQVTDPQGGALPGVTVVVRNQNTGMFRETVSNNDGTYFVSGLVPGTYEITAELAGFKQFSRRDVPLEIGRTATVDIVLEVGALTEVVTVTGTTSTLDLTSKEVGGASATASCRACRRSTATSSASSASCRASCPTSAPSRSAATR